MMERMILMVVGVALCFCSGCFSPSLGVSASRSRILQPSNGEFATHGTFVIRGAATRPGSYPVSWRMTLTQAVAAAGGVTKDASAYVDVIHANSSLKGARHNLADIRAGKAKDPAIKSGDMILLLKSE